MVGSSAGRCGKTDRGVTIVIHFAHGDLGTMICQLRDLPKLRNLP